MPPGFMGYAGPPSREQCLSTRDVTLARGGPVSRLLDGLGASAVGRLDVVKDTQSVFNMPRRLKARDGVAG